MFRITRIHHASFLVEDLERAEHFYTQTLGLTRIPRPDLGYPGLWLQINTSEQLHLMQLPDPDAGRQAPEHGGRDRHLAVAVEGLDILEQRLNELDWDYTRSRSGRQALFCRDPDGNALEFIQLT